MDPVNKKVSKLRRDIPAWNVDGSSKDQLEGCSWITFWENTTGLERGRCSYTDCCKDANVGGHIWIKHRGVHIAPICSGCNWSVNMKRMQSLSGNHSFLRAGTVVVKVEYTEEMRNAERRLTEEVRVQSENDEMTSVSSGSDEYDEVDSSGESEEDEQQRYPFRQCNHCQVDISDQPRHHYQCYDCFRSGSFKRPRLY